ncbi:hypothetical protein PIB30_092581, partial [Stylosanthes scabra]|nr:hypothetical protein [Stylosanthes scabra]
MHQDLLIMILTQRYSIPVGGIIQILDGAIKEIKDRRTTTIISSNNQHLLCNQMHIKSLLNWRLLFRNYLNQLLNLLIKLKASCKKQKLTSKLGSFNSKLGSPSWSDCNERPPNTLRSNTIPNPKEECKATNLRSGKQVGKELEEPTE